MGRVNKKEFRKKSRAKPPSTKMETRLPDYYFRDIPISSKALRYYKLDLDPLGNGTVQSVKIVLPREMIVSKVRLWATGKFELFSILDIRITDFKYQIETYRQRISGSSKKKLLNIVPGIIRPATASPDEIILSCDKIFAFDTNTKKIGDSVISVLGISNARASVLNRPRFVSIRNTHAIEFRNLMQPYEKVGWLMGLNAAIDLGWIDPSEKVGIIVDSYSNEIMDLNNGEELFPGYKKPDNVNFIYASSDTGQSYVLNQCIRMADRSANLVFQSIRDKKVDDQSLRIGGNPHFDKYRFWEFEEGDGSVPSVNINFYEYSMNDSSLK